MDERRAIKSAAASVWIWSVSVDDGLSAKHTRRRRQPLDRDVHSDTAGANVIIVVSLSVLMSMVLAAQDRFTLKARNGKVQRFHFYELRQKVSTPQTAP